MKGLYIEKIIAKGVSGKESIIKLDKGVNLIVGPSNTGKTCITKTIDFCLGSSNQPFTDTFGYDEVSIYLHTPKGEINISRKLKKK